MFYLNTIKIPQFIHVNQDNFIQIIVNNRNNFNTIIQIRFSMQIIRKTPCFKQFYCHFVNNFTPQSTNYPFTMKLSLITIFITARLIVIKLDFYPINRKTAASG